MSKANVSSVSICAEQSSRPIDPPVSDLDLDSTIDESFDQSAVNHAILLSLNRLKTKILQALLSNIRKLMLQ